jgi:hypothetical protein
MWRESGPNLEKMLAGDPYLAMRIRGWKTLFVPTRSGNAKLLWSPDLGERSPAPFKDLALSYFMKLLINPYWDMLGGPCYRCDNYYIKNTKRQKVYCSRGCATAATAIPATRKRRNAEHVKKLNKAEQAINLWALRRRRKDWKEWVHDQTGLTVKWLTRAANLGDLIPPDRP